MSFHAALKQIEDVLVVGVGNESESSAIVHELLKLWWLIEAELINSDLLLLALDVIIFLVFRASWESLPWQRSAQEIKKDVANSF